VNSHPVSRSIGDRGRGGIVAAKKQPGVPFLAFQSMRQAELVFGCDVGRLDPFHRFGVQTFDPA
jgi:hypothetical protein